MILFQQGVELPVWKLPVVIALALLVNCFTQGVTLAQIPPSAPDPMSISVGVTFVLPLGNLGTNDWDDGRYATAGTALTQRLSYAPLESFGFFIQAAFPAFGVDATAVGSDYKAIFGSTTDVTGGSNEIVSWSAGVRWRGGRSWNRGLYVEGMLGSYRDRLSLEIAGDTADTTFSWETGWGVSAGWIIPVGPAFAVDIGIIMHEFREEYFINRWTGLRLLAVMTFGGER